MVHPVVKLENFSKVYVGSEVEVHAVRNVSLEIQPGEFVAIMGASGSGKSTMLNTLGCLDRPTSGKFFLDGVDTGTLGRNELADLRNRKIGFVFQGFNLLSRTTALENVELPLMYARPGLPNSDQRDRALHSLEQVGLDERAHHHPSQLSGGQQQRVAIARALVNDPALLLADEPTGNLDSATSIDIMGIFQSLNQRGMTIVMVTHELDIARYTQRMVVMRDGRILRDEQVNNRLKAADELDKLRQEQQAVQLTT
ncbi:MAG TPA: ABC transporter ATP-binding protein [Candidatus Binatia bacterium]|nr:ABC transporter ATP-binding protein [Candidatus Binatia bacterium]